MRDRGCGGGGRVGFLVACRSLLLLVFGSLILDDGRCKEKMMPQKKLFLIFLEILT